VAAFLDALSACSKPSRVRGDDHPGAVADILKKLADARITVGALQAVCGGAGTYGAVIFVSSAAARKAGTVLGAV
jgi:hypothetical protein